MRDFFRAIWSDITRLKYIDLYLILFIVVVIFFVDVFGIEIGEPLIEIVLAALAVLIYGMIETRRFNERMDFHFHEYADKLSIIEREYTNVNKALSRFAQASVYLKRNESYISLLNAVNRAKTSIDIISYAKLRTTDRQRNRFYEALERAIVENQVTHQRIVWNLDQLQWLEQRLEEGWDKFEGFSVKFYRIDSDDSYPLTTFDLYDQEIIIVGQDWLLEGHLEIVSGSVGQYFRGYFSNIWNRSESIKERGHPPDLKKLEQLIQESGGCQQNV